MTSVTDDRERQIRSDPFCELLGVELAEVGPGTAKTRLTIEESHLNFHGIPHGGAIYALADAAFAAASNAEGTDAYALETNISYLEAVPAGTVLEAAADRTHETSRTAEYEVVVVDGDGDRVATFRGRVYKP